MDVIIACIMALISCLVALREGIAHNGRSQPQASSGLSRGQRHAYGHRRRRDMEAAISKRC